jgi:hypothetical protein
LKNFLKIARPSALLFLAVAVIQGMSLLRNYSSEPVCGRILNIVMNFNVLVNCDSAVFMKDAQNPSRLFNGQSVYQDRPGHAGVIWVVGNILKIVGFPNQTREIIGTSGVATQYESIFYISFVLANFIILLTAVFLSLQFMGEWNSRSNNFSGFSIAIIVVMVVAANELTKTFFWTPHSQMFNILLPVLALVMIEQRKGINNLKSFLFASALIFGLMFFYPLFGILFSILIFAKYANLFKRIVILQLFIITFLLYSKIINSVGGSYSNFALEHYRQYVWIFDSLANGNLQEKLSANLKAFIFTFPIFPSILLVVTIVLLAFVATTSAQSATRFKSSTLPYLLFLSLYVFALAMMGYYSRRLTLGVMIYVELLLLKNSASLLSERYQRTWHLAMSLLILILIGSWVWTNGPLA